MQVRIPHRLLIVFAGILCLLLKEKAGAVQVYGTSGTGSTYTTAPADNFGFANVAQVFDPSDGIYASGVYLGNGWMLSAYHVVRNGSGGFQFGNVYLDGTSYGVNAITAARITDPVSHNPVDLAMFQLTVAPADSNLKTKLISGTTPATNSNLILMGGGFNRVDSPTYWSVDNNTDPWTWTQTSQTHGNNILSGYFTGSGQSLRWGTGIVSGTLSGDVGYGMTSFLSTTFQNTTGSGMASGGDSGGGVFYKRGSTWELSGIMLYIGKLSGQPAGTSVPGDETYAANLSYYASQINSTAAVQAPVITTQPAGVTILEGGSTTFTTSATGTPPPGYQWQRMALGSGTWVNVTDISGTYAGSSTSALLLSNVGYAMNGDQFRCVASNGILPNATSNAVTLAVQSGYVAWATPYFGSQISNSAISGPAATPMNDGIPNALKYLCNINPAVPMNATSRAALPAAGLVTISGTQYLTLTYRRNQNTPGLVLSVETSADLQTWTTVIPDSTQTIGTDASTGDPIIQIQVKNSGGQKMFLRLKMTLSV